METRDARLIHRSKNSKVFIARVEGHASPVILKVLSAARPSREQVAQFNREYDLTHDLRVQGARRALEKGRHEGHPALVLALVEGVTLQDRLSSASIPIEAGLTLGASIAGVLSRVHAQGIVHKDITPNNIIIDADGAAHLIDFGIASRVTLKATWLGSASRLEGTLKYMAPEQTGRMNRAVDARSDLYGLGVVLYEMLAGRAPFESEDPLELVHSHIARIPERPSALPAPVWAVIARLLAKTPEDRYQTAEGLRIDLERCLEGLAAGKLEAFELGQADVSGQVILPEKLYGRDVEVAMLMGAFARAQGGANEALLVSGYAGVGKSALVQELHRPVAEARGFFVSGKFDQFQRATPYQAFIQAFTGFVERLLGADAARLTRWRDRLNAALAPNGRVLTEVIPGLAHVIGEQPPVAALDPSEAANRIGRTFQQFVNAISTAEHPLVLFLDDLQWADAGSLNLLRALTTSPDGDFTVTICAFRDNEVGDAHPFIQTVDEMEADGAKLSRLHVTNLQAVAVAALVGDTLNTRGSGPIDLAALIFEKTQGNPFFTLEFLRSLFHEGLLTFDAQARRWRWDLAAIRARAVTDNVVDLLQARIGALTGEAQALLTLGAGVGNAFDLRTLAVVSDQDLPSTLDGVWPAIEAGLLLPLDLGFREIRAGVGDGEAPARVRFAHDRVQEAAYALIPAAERPATHLRIGRLMERRRRARGDADVFTVVGQLNAGRALIDDPVERLSLARLNLAAAQRAHASAAFHPAAEYADVGLACLPADAWTTQYADTLALHKIAGLAHIVLAEFTTSERLLRAVLTHGASVLDQVDAYSLLMMQCIFSMDYEASLEMGRQALGLLGVDFPATDLQPILGQKMEVIGALMAERDLDTLSEWDETEDPTAIAVSKLAEAIGPPSFILGRLEEWTHSVLIGVNVALTAGLCRNSSYALVQHGMILSVFGMKQAGYELALKGCRLADRWGVATVDQSIKGRFLLAEFVMPWVRPYAESDAVGQAVRKAAMDTGNHIWAGWVDLHRAMHWYAEGRPLDGLLETAAAVLNRNRRFKHEQAVAAVEGLQTIMAFLVQDAPPDEADNAAGDAYLARVRAIGNSFGVRQYLVYRGQALCLLGDYAGAAACLAESRAFMAGQGLAGIEVPQDFFEALALIKLAQVAEAPEQAALRARFAPRVEAVQTAATNNPANFGAKAAIIDAELAALDAEGLRALTHFNAAIALAVEHGIVPDQALANELAGAHLVAAGSTRTAMSHLVEARYAYGFWGARLKQRHLSERYPGLATASSQGPRSAGLTVTATTTSGVDAASIDLLSVLKASQSIAGEIVLARLLERLMHTVIENAGAQRGHLLRLDDGGLVLQASADADGADTQVLQGTPVAGCGVLPESVVAYARRTREVVLIEDVARHSGFSDDPYFKARSVSSVLCMPIIGHGELGAIMYLENDHAVGAFTRDRLEVLELLSGQIAVALENATLYATMEHKVEERTREIAAERDKSERLLLNILPRQTAEELKTTGEAVARTYASASVLFTDFVGFTRLTRDMAPGALVSALHTCFSRFDAIVKACGLEKIKTIGDAYMCAGGVPVERTTHAIEAVAAGLEMIRAMAQIRAERADIAGWRCRIGVHSGPVITGVVGTDKFVFDLWGDTVNIASRLECAGAPGRVNVSAATWAAIEPFFVGTARGTVEVKGGRAVEMYFVDGIRPALSRDGAGVEPGDGFWRQLEALRIGG